MEYIDSIISNSIHKTISAEARVLSQIQKLNPEQIALAVKLVLESTGKVIVSGIGKSAIIAQKMSSTLNSTGTSSTFLHGADAIHGDLGIINANDVVIFISKSGNNAELELLWPALNTKRVKTVGIVSNDSGFLFKNANVVIYIPIDTEADDFNIVPTVSCIAHLAAGHAIAIALMKVRNFTPDDFASFHPGGSLGKQLSYTIAQILDTTKKPMVSPGTSIRDAIFEITRSRVGACAVMDQDVLVGIITDGDIRRAFSVYDVVSNIYAQTIMTKNPATIEEGEKAWRAMEMMRELKISQLIVLKNGYYQGIIHFHDLIKEGFS